MKNPTNNRFETDNSPGAFSEVVKAGRRTYFFDVKTTRNNDYYIVITESRRKLESGNGGPYEKQKLFLYREDFNKFLACLQDSLEYIEMCSSPMENDDTEQLILEHAISMEPEKEFELL